ncbi:MAG: thioesterase family protein [Chloroflexota bacterium]
MNDIPASPQPFMVELELPVRTYDIDFAGLVSNIVYIRWLEDLRLQILAEYLPLEQQLAQGYGPVLVSTQIEYRHPIRLFDRPVGRMWLDKLGRTSWTAKAEILLDGRAAAVATQVGVFVDYTTLKPVAVPAELRARFEQSQQ